MNLKAFCFGTSRRHSVSRKSKNFAKIHIISLQQVPKLQLVYIERTDQADGQAINFGADSRVMMVLILLQC